MYGVPGSELSQGPDPPPPRPWYFDLNRSESRLTAPVTNSAREDGSPNGIAIGWDLTVEEPRWIAKGSHPRCLGGNRALRSD
ncbi:hypothetical protein N7468_009388 [Penicillium chermesinum]|uniref:Uncharacterized protein n=1 Tax=Penicillium chermesinum TaxID=63820 RepID=A0A9W9NHL5_9EURO|nr:uncharacterized protein N7468_009388 [Penicillium chermesinum]KAJ5220184.1 hypothetical protein N7468_009388 [Penicillium chermesinum]